MRISSFSGFSGTSFSARSTWAVLLTCVLAVSSVGIYSGQADAASAPNTSSRLKSAKDKTTKSLDNANKKAKSSKSSKCRTRASSIQKTTNSIKKLTDKSDLTEYLTLGMNLFSLSTDLQAAGCEDDVLSEVYTAVSQARLLESILGGEKKSSKKVANRGTSGTSKGTSGSSSKSSGKSNSKPLNDKAALDDAIGKAREAAQEDAAKKGKTAGTSSAAGTAGTAGTAGKTSSKESKESKATVTKETSKHKSGSNSASNDATNESKTDSKTDSKSVQAGIQTNRLLLISRAKKVAQNKAAQETTPIKDSELTKILVNTFYQEAASEEEDSDDARVKVLTQKLAKHTFTCHQLVVMLSEIEDEAAQDAFMQFAENRVSDPENLPNVMRTLEESDRFLGE